MVDLYFAIELFQKFIIAGGIMRIIYCFLKIITNNEEKTLYKKRIKHVVIFLILSESIFVIRALIEFYYK